MIHYCPPLAAKIKITLWTLVIIFVLIAARLFHLQIILQSNFYTKSQKNFLRFETITPLRGSILDRNNQLIATNRPTTNIYWQGTGNSRFSPAQLQTLSLLEIIIGKPLQSNGTFYDQLRTAERRYQKMLIAEDIPFDQFSKVVERLSDQKNILISTHFKRFYPYNSFASHLVGYLSRLDMETHGRTGLEKMCETILKGQNGQKIKTINSIGRNLSEKEIKKAEAGQNITTTLDIGLQKMVEKVFPEEFVGTFILMDPAEGDILALLSRPNFDPALFLEPMQINEWQSLQNKQPFLNRAFNACYPPGSIFKLVTVTALLESGVIQPESSWNCRGFSEFCGRQYWCNNKHGHGLLNVEQSLAHSCNIMFYETAKKVSIDLFADYAYRFGLGQKTDIIFAEKEGLIPSTAWKRKVKKEKWWPGETLSVSIGQSYLLATPIQIARMISSIFTGNLVKPRVLLSEPVQISPLGISSETLSFLQQSMYKVVNQGTGRRVKQITDIKIFAKTSTAQTSGLDKHNLGEQYLEHGWFVGYFYYKDQKPLTIAILVEHAATSRVPTTIAANFLREYKKMIDFS